MAIFNSYVCLPEGRQGCLIQIHLHGIYLKEKWLRLCDWTAQCWWLHRHDAMGDNPIPLICCTLRAPESINRS